MSALEILDLWKSYAGAPVLVGLDLEVPERSITAILGPSGSGKTTLLRLIVGFERADHGVIHLHGDVVDDTTSFVPSDRRRIGYVPQDGSLFPHLTVARNVAFGLPRGERRSKRVEELLAMVGLSQLGRRYPHELSGGEQQRVALARALAIGPTLVLLDEPFSSLDAGLRSSVRGEVRDVLRSSGTTALIVTHDQDEALSLADHVAVLRDGGVGQYDTPQRLYARPASATLAAGLGASNLLPGRSRGALVETPLGLLQLASDVDAEPLADGTELTVLVRAEQLFWSSPEEAPEICARVVATEFYGHDAVVRLLAEWDESTSIVLRTPKPDTLPRIGDRVGLVVRGAVVAWRDQSATSSSSSSTRGAHR